MLETEQTPGRTARGQRLSLDQVGGVEIPVPQLHFEVMAAVLIRTPLSTG